MTKKIFAAVTLILIFGSVFMAGCGGTKEGGEGKNTEGAAPVKVRIALQYGLGYAPLQIAQEQKLIEKYLPGAQVEWKEMGTGGLIREAFVSGDLDAGFMAIPPYLVGWDQGGDWKISMALGSAPQGLQTYRKDITTLKDFKPGDKIAVPIPGSIQHILLAMAAEKELGNPKALDNNLVSMTHPDGATALISESGIAAHYTSPPYLFKELDSPNVKQIVDAEKAFGGEHTFLVGVATKTFHDNNPAAYAAFVAAISEAISFINNNPQEAAKILAPKYKMEPAQVEKYMTWPGTNYTSTPYGIMGFADFMKKAGYIKKVPNSLDEIAWENVVAAIGKKSGGKSPVEQAQYRNE